MELFCNCENKINTSWNIFVFKVDNNAIYEHFCILFFSSLLRREEDSSRSLEAFLKNSGRNYNFRKTVTALKYELGDQNQPFLPTIVTDLASYTNSKTLLLLGARTAITDLLALKNVLVFLPNNSKP